MPVNSCALLFTVPPTPAGKGQLAILLVEQAHPIPPDVAKLISVEFSTVVWLFKEKPAVKPNPSDHPDHCCHIFLPCGSEDRYGIAFELQWPLAGLVLRQRLRRGENILLCGPEAVCKGLAIRLLKELGDALPHNLQQTIPGCTAGLVDSLPTDSVQWMAQQDALVDKQWGCLLGGMLGAGWADRLVQPSTSRTLDVGDCQQDQSTIFLRADHGSQMMLATIYGLRYRRNNHEVVPAVRNAYQAWLAGQRGQRIACEWIAQFPAMQTRHHSDSSHKYPHAQPWQGHPKKLEAPRDAGALLHIAPVILLQGLSLTAKEQLANDICAITHLDPVTRRACRIWINLLDAMLHNAPLSEALQALRETPSTQPMPDSLQQALYRSEMLWLTGVPYGASLMNDGCATEDVLGIALYAMLSACSLAEVIQLSTHHHGDRISTATLAMQLFGTQHGLSGLPWNQIIQLDLWTALLAMPSFSKVGNFNFPQIDRSQQPSLTLEFTQDSRPILRHYCDTL